MTKFRIGCSGWSYNQWWVGPFNPPETRATVSSITGLSSIASSNVVAPRNLLYQLFVNGEKHHSDKIGEILYGGKSKKEIAEFFRDLENTISLCKKLVSITKKRGEVGS